MKKLMLLSAVALTALAATLISSVQPIDHRPSVPNCQCDTLLAKSIVFDSTFNTIPHYDTTSFSAENLYELGAEENRKLWFRDVENPDSTKFTKHWNSYYENAYYADHLDFLDFYEQRKDVDLAFQFGPNMDLWAYHIFVIKKLECCYLATRSYYRHARFTYKAYAFLDSQKLDSLYIALNATEQLPIDTVSGHYAGYFVDNRNDKKFFIDFKAQVDRSTNKPKQEILDLYDFIDNRIEWTLSYRL